MLLQTKPLESQFLGVIAGVSLVCRQPCIASIPTPIVAAHLGQTRNKVLKLSIV
jgi:hypothetical protein